MADERHIDKVIALLQKDPTWRVLMIVRSVSDHQILLRKLNQLELVESVGGGRAIYIKGHPIRKDPSVVTAEVGAPLIGARFDIVVAAAGVRDPTLEPRSDDAARRDDWFRSCVMARTVPGGLFVAYA